MIALIASIALACWCWFGRGPCFLRWPALVLVVFFTSGHPLAGAFGPALENIGMALLPLLLVGLGIKVILFGFGSSRRRREYDDRYHFHDGRRRRGGWW